MEETQQLVHLGAATTVPLRRLGALLHDARITAGDELVEVAARSDGRFAGDDLLGIEAGARRLTDDDVVTLLALYRADPGDLLAARSTLVIDLDEGTVAAGSWSTSFPPGADDPDDVLARYLALLYEMRGLEPGAPIPLRTLDVSVLSSALSMPAPAVHERLVVLMEPGNLRVERARRLLSRRLLVPAAGLVVAATAAGVLLFSPPSTVPATGTEVGRAVGAALGTPIIAAELEAGSTPQMAPPGAAAEISEGLAIEREAPPPPAEAPAGEAEVGDGLTVEAPPQVAPPGYEGPEIGEGLTVERGDVDGIVSTDAT